MEAFLHQIFSGLANGCIYGSVALALVMIYQATHHRSEEHTSELQSPC